MFLNQIECQKYYKAFEDEEILTLEDICKLTEGDLKDIGVKLGSRNRIMELITKIKQGEVDLKPKKKNPV